MKYVKILFRVLVWLLVVAGLLLLILYFAQNMLLYPKHSFGGGDAGWDSRMAVVTNRGYTPILLPGAKEGTKVRALWAENREGVVPAVLWFHGRDEDITEQLGVVGPLREQGMHVLAMEYPGYGDNKDPISEAEILSRAEASFDFLAAKDVVAPRRIWVGGNEIGANVALLLAARRPAAGVIAFATLPDMETAVAALLKGVRVDFLLKDHYAIDGILTAISGPVLFVHGAVDTLVTPDSVEAFAKKPMRARVMRIDGGGRANLPSKLVRDQWNEIGNFIMKGGR